MEGYPYSNSDSSPRSLEVDADHTWDDGHQAPAAARAKLMCSYGGRIQPRQNDTNQLTYVGGDTKILAVDRSIRFPAMVARLGSLSGAEDFLVKYQLPGEDLDALVSVTNDEDLEHMMLEYDRLHRSAVKPIQRLRVFLFPPMIGRSSLSPPPQVSPPDYLFGLDDGFVPPPAVKVKDPEPEVPPVTSPPVISPVVSEIQRNGSEETLTRVYPAEYNFVPPRVSDQSPPTPTPAPTYWPEPPRSMAPTGVYASVAGGGEQQQPLYFIPAMAPPVGQGYYTTMQRMVPSSAYDGSSAAAQPMYAMTSAGQGGAAYDSGIHLAYDSNGRVVCYPAVGSVAMNPESKVLKPPKVA